MSNGTEKTHRPLGKGLPPFCPASGRFCGSAAPKTPEAPKSQEQRRPEPVPSTLLIDKISPESSTAPNSLSSDKLEELAASIRANGIIQPLIVRGALGKHIRLSQENDAGAPLKLRDLLRCR